MAPGTEVYPSTRGRGVSRVVRDGEHGRSHDQYGDTGNVDVTGSVLGRVPTHIGPESPESDLLLSGGIRGRPTHSLHRHSQGSDVRVVTTRASNHDVCSDITVASGTYVVWTTHRRWTSEVGRQSSPWLRSYPV